MTAFADALRRAGATETSLDAEHKQALDEQGYTILRGVIAEDELPALRERFEAATLIPARAPRAADARHAELNDDDAVRRACLAPTVLAMIAHAIDGRFYLHDVQGREPRPGGGYQFLHRDWPDDGPGTRYIVGLAFLDDYNAANGATRLVPGTHLLAGGMDDFKPFGEHHPEQIVVEGAAGDFLLFHGRLAHGGGRNVSGAPRRTLQIAYMAHSEYRAEHDTRDLAQLDVLDRYLMGGD